MTINYIEGDLFAGVKSETEKVLLPHCCNVFGAWGSGFVIPLQKNFPHSREAYLDWHNAGGNICLSEVTKYYQGKKVVPHFFREDYNYEVYDLFKLGQTQFVPVPNSNVIVANMVAQTLGGHRPLYYNHLSNCMDQVANYANERGISKIVAPCFGAGLAMGKWSIIEELINDCWLEENLEVTVYYLEQTKPEGLNP